MVEKKKGKATDNQRTIFLCHGTGCVSGKAFKIRKALEEGLAGLGLDGTKVDFTGCHGFCAQGPIVIIEPEGIFYTHISLDDVPEIIQCHIRDGKPVARLFYKEPTSGEAVPYYKDINFYKKQRRIILRNCGRINPERIEDYIAIGGYQPLRRAVLDMTPEQVIDEVKHSGLRGRGGAGFPTGRKWQSCRDAPGNQKYMICNADEGDPGAFMDRSTLEGDPHTVIEGMAIAAYAIGATEGYIYIRAEYPLAVKRVQIAIAQAEEMGFLGHNILDCGLTFNIKIFQGAGAFVCGESTALILSIEGKRGMPKPSPRPRTTEVGLWGRPTVINNVKSLATVPVIIDKGAEWYTAIGTEKSKGTAVFALTGKIANSGLVEVPMGVSLQEIIYEIGGGIADGRRFKAVQTGGPSGGCLPASHLNLPVDYESLTEAGSIMGSGGVVVMDEDTCMVDIARYFLAFTQSESCGKCAPCRLGTKQMLGILERICNGQGRMEDIDLLLELSESIKTSSLCGLGQSAPNPVLTTLRYFRDEYEEHIKKHHCRAAVCKGLVKAPCSHTCPAGIDVPRYIRFIEQGRPDEALAVIREKIPFPSVCGLVCFHPCETKCRRGQLDEAIAIRELKRYATEHGGNLWKKRAVAAPPTGKRVAIVGSGPAGLTAAYYLAKLGHSVTVFEALPETGGMLRMAIPEYRLPKSVLKAEIKEIEDLGVEIKTNTEIHYVESLFQQGYDAAFVAIGAQQNVMMGIEDKESPRFIDRLAFLRDVNMGKKVSLGDRVAVIGGGHAAIDVARVARRLGSKEVTIIYRRSRADMPASVEEIEEAIAEGIAILERTMPTGVVHENRDITLECIRMKPGAIDSGGRRRPEPVAGTEFTLRFDNIVASIGQRLMVSDQFDLPVDKGDFIKVDRDTLATPKQSVFAGGDAVTGPASVIEAIAQGRQAAISIDKYLGGRGNIDEVLSSPEKEVFPLEETEEKRRPQASTLPLKRRLGGFAQVELGYSEKMAVEEAGRCLRCDLEEDD
ncbi:FAD-dependent oxidoreductase [Chloroflexota bacterium]